MAIKLTVDDNDDEGDVDAGDVDDDNEDKNEDGPRSLLVKVLTGHGFKSINKPPKPADADSN